MVTVDAGFRLDQTDGSLKMMLSPDLSVRVIVAVVILLKKDQWIQPWALPGG
jgi:hypothetical protein